MCWLCLRFLDQEWYGPVPNRANNFNDIHKPIRYISQCISV